jgi:hypothetical protein
MFLIHYKKVEFGCVFIAIVSLKTYVTNIFDLVV